MQKAILSESAAVEWALRGDYWLGKLNRKPQYNAVKRHEKHEPLILNGHGLRLSIHSGTLLIKCGFTHYPQTQESYRFFPKDRQLPSKIVVLDSSGSISFDALKWLSVQNVPLVQLNWKGEVLNTSGTAYSADPDIVYQQIEKLKNGKSFQYSKGLILQKIINCYEVIHSHNENSEIKSEILSKIENKLKILKTNKINNYEDLLNIEAVCAAAYFRYWKTFKINWVGVNKSPVPEEWLKITDRIGKNNNNKFAIHPINAILNYAYGVLENQVYTQVIAMGFDPTIAFMHSHIKNRNSFVYDMMEPVRPLMEKEVFNFVLKHKFSPHDFILNDDGICRLHPQFSRFLVKKIQGIKEVNEIVSLNLRSLITPYI